MHGKENDMNINEHLSKIKKHPKYNQIGMILTHIGIVRGSSREGKKVSGLKVQVDNEKLESIINIQKAKPGIIEILIEIADQKVLSVGEDIMILAIAGDTRASIIPVLSATIDAIKTIATTKTEFYI
jgi:molybdopterin synthase catalytic subunit